MWPTAQVASAVTTHHADRAGDAGAAVGYPFGFLASDRYCWCKWHLSDFATSSNQASSGSPGLRDLGGQCHLPGLLWTRPVAGSLTVSGRSELRRSTRSEERRVGKECRSRWSPYN